MTVPLGRAGRTAFLAAGLFCACSKAPAASSVPEPACDLAPTAAWTGLGSEAGRSVVFSGGAAVLGAPSAGAHGGLWTAGLDTPGPATLLLAPGGTRVGSTVLVHEDKLHAIGESEEGGAAVWTPDAQDLQTLGSGPSKGATAASAAGALWVGLPWAGPGEVWSVQEDEAFVAWRGEAPRSFAGSTVVDAGDTNGDGVPELLVGAFGAEGSAGKAYLVSAHETGALADAAAWIRGAASFQLLGFSGAAGDLDGDGYSDVVVGIPGLSATGTSSGGVAVYFGPLQGGLQLQDARAGVVGGESHHGAGWAVAVRPGPQPGLAIGGRLYGGGRGAAWVVEAPTTGTLTLGRPDLVGDEASEAGASVAVGETACGPVLVGGPGTGSAWLFAAP